ncbi:class I tRNA ligase family protein, partial [Patescibacteria group bacterium]|nr:class I tRNA ligase family protein [Patescibacteria group bacterium]
GMLLSAKLPSPKTIFVHGFITSGGEKISKTIGNVVDPFKVAAKYGTDALRYYLLREIPSGEDGDFTYEKFEERYSADLAKGVGNLTARILTLAQKGKIKPLKNKFASEIAKIKKDSAQSVSEFKFNEALEKIWRLIALGDKYINAQKPWTLESNSKKFKEIIGHLLFLLLGVGELLIPFMPETADKIAKHVAKSKSTVLFPQLK